ncbi:adenylyltransferase/cytidyltransferase family protein [Candidatus Gottesmanbacteria bacterium]|nr:adenylyltransferase/cytidyltransferase family protein [Candidatus Gottesmanbacteria bacterium]
MQKLVRITELTKIIKKAKSEGKKIIQCHGVFDLLHPGHIRHFASAKKYGDILIVTITADKFVKKGPGRPIFNENLRAESLAAIEFIDYIVIVFSDSSKDSILKIKPDFYIKGPDYKKRKISPYISQKLLAEEKAVIESGGKLIITEDQVVFSSSKLINEYLEVYPATTKKYLDSLKQKYTKDYLLEKLDLIRKIKVLIIGDAIIDQYNFCAPIGKSSKEPVIVHKFISSESYLGGVLATANHTSSVCNEVGLVTLLGKKKSYEKFIRKHLKNNISEKFFYRQDSGTIVKSRYIDGVIYQKLFQVSFMKDEIISDDLSQKISQYLRAEIKKYDMVIVNDYGHGMLTRRMIQTICRSAKYLALNVQANSANYGFNVITKYPRADFICIDDQELRLAAQDRHSDLIKLVNKIYKKMKCMDMIVTKGSQGSISLGSDKKIIETPALNQKIVDRVGAGDAFFAISAPCAYSGMDKDLVSFMGNVAGGLKVQTIGNSKQIDFTEMIKFITSLLK